VFTDAGVVLWLIRLFFVSTQSSTVVALVGLLITLASRYALSPNPFVMVLTPLLLVSLQTLQIELHFLSPLLFLLIVGRYELHALLLA
jgi:hypothetical protein